MIKNTITKKTKAMIKAGGILILLILFVTPTFSQVNITISDYSFEKFQESGLKFESAKQKYLKTNIESCQLNEENKLRFNEKISSTIYLWNSVNVLKDLKASKVVYGVDQERLVTEEEIVSLENFNELLGKRSQHTLMSLVVTEEKDTLLLFFISRSLMCKNVKEINYLYKQLTIANDSKNFVLKDTTLFKTEIQIPLLVSPLSTFNKNYKKRKVHIQALNSAFASTQDKQTENYTYYIKQEIPDNYQADIIYGLNQSISKEVIAIDSNNIILSVQKESNQAGSEYYPIYNTKDDSFLGLLFYSMQDDRLQFLDVVTSKERRLEAKRKEIAEKYKAQIEKADQLYADMNYAESILAYTEAKAIQSSAPYPDVQIEKANLKISEALQLKADVVSLKKHISVLEENGLVLTETEKIELNKNFQDRIINTLETSDLPKYYLVTVNRTEPSFQTKAYFYIVTEFNNSFYGLGGKNIDFPVMDTVLNSQLMIDSVQLIYDIEGVKNKIRTTDYISYFYEQQKSSSNYKGKDKYYRAIEVPSLRKSDTLFKTFSKYGDSLLLTELPTYEEFVKKYTIDVKMEDYPLSKLFGYYGRLNPKNDRGYALVENHLYSKDTIIFAFEPRIADNQNTINQSYESTTIYSFDKDKMFEFYSGFKTFYEIEKEKLEARKKEEELAAKKQLEQEKLELSKKYGKKYVDAMYNLKIIIGMHEDLVNVLVNKLYTVGSSSSSNSGNYFRLDPRYGTGWVSVWIKNKKVTSVTYH